MRAKLAIFAGLLPAMLSVAGCVSIGNGQLPRTGDRSAHFASGGNLEISLPVGSVHVEIAEGNWLRLHYHIRKHHFAFWGWSPAESRARLRFEAEGQNAVISFHYPPGTSNAGQIDVIVDVPAQTNLHVKTGVGEIRIAGGIAGDKYVNTGVGDIRVALGPNPDYRRVQISTGVGSIIGGPWGQGQGFVAKALDAHPGGRFRLRLHAGVGSIHLQS